jgi:hypothetical protein
MMYRNIPSKASLSTTSFGISRREIFLLGAAVLVGLTLLAVPYAPIFGRVVLSFLFMGGMTIYTFWRVEKQWPIEVYLFNRLKYEARGRAFVRGGQRTLSRQEGNGAEYEKIPETYSPAGGVLLEVSWFSNQQMAASVLGVVILAVLLAWVGTGGVVDAQIQLQILFRNPR